MDKFVIKTPSIRNIIENSLFKFYFFIYYSFRERISGEYRRRYYTKNTEKEISYD